LAGSFDTTQWSVVAAAAQSGETQAREALAVLCGRYWEPLYVFARRIGHDPAEAEDLTQGFFAHLIEKRTLRAARRERGRFRSFLLASFKNFIADQRDHAQAVKRGGRIRAVPLDVAEAEEGFAASLKAADTPETLFEQRWAHALLRAALDEVRVAYEADDASRVFECLRETLVGGSDDSYRTIAATVGMTEGALKVAAHRLRRRFGRALRAEVARTVDPGEVEEELRHLLAVVSR
jgi:RNA polymerase sigma factor (sigma-70 family)